MPAATKGLVEAVVPALKGLYTELPKTCFGEPLKWGVLRIAELSWAASVGSIFILIISLISGKAGGSVAVTLIGLLLAGTQVTFSSMLFIGVCKNEPSYMKPWFWYAVVLCVLYMVLATIGIIAAPFLPGNASHAFLGYYIVVVVFCAILRYCAQVVHALMQEMQTFPTDRKSMSIGASSTKDGHSDSGSAHLDEDVFSNEADVRTLQYVVKLND